MNSSTWSVYKMLKSWVLTDLSTYSCAHTRTSFLSLSPTHTHTRFILSTCAGLSQILLQPTALMGSADLCSHFSPGPGRRGMPFSTLKDTQTPTHTLILHHLDPDPCSIFSRGAEKRALLSCRATSSWRKVRGHRWASTREISPASSLLKMLGLKINKSNELERRGEKNKRKEENAREEKSDRKGEKIGRRG